MTVETFFTSDTHFGHAKLLGLVASRGARFTSIEEHDAVLEENWNKTVRPGDEVFHLGDLAFLNRRLLGALLNRLNGRKFLLLGNHDKLPPVWYGQWFKVLPQPYPWGRTVALTHAPIHPMCLGGRWGANIHGHIHESRVMKHGSWIKSAQVDRKYRDPRYINVCVEHTDWRPVNADELPVRHYGEA